MMTFHILDCSFPIFLIFCFVIIAEEPQILGEMGIITEEQLETLHLKRPREQFIKCTERNRKNIVDVI